MVKESPAKQMTELVYSTAHCSISQCDATRDFIFTFFGEKLRLKLCSLLALKQRLQKVDIEHLLLSDYNSGLEVIPLHCHDRIFVLTPEEILEMQDLLAGSFSMLEINSFIQSKFHRAFA